MEPAWLQRSRHCEARSLPQWLGGHAWAALMNMCSPRRDQYVPTRRDAGYCRPPAITARGAANSGLDLLEVAASTATSNPSLPAAALTTAGPYNPAAFFPPKVVKKVLDLGFVEMTELRADIWVDERQAPEAGVPMRRPPSKPPVTDIKVWSEYYARMAALLVSRYPHKGPELWAYQTMILRAVQLAMASTVVQQPRALALRTEVPQLQHKSLPVLVVPIPTCV